MSWYRIRSRLNANDFNKRHLIAERSEVVTVLIFLSFFIELLRLIARETLQSLNFIALVIGKVRIFRKH